MGITTDNPIEDEEIIEFKIMTAQEELIKSMERPTLEYIRKGKRFKKDKRGNRVPVDTTKLRWTKDKKGNITILDSIPRKKGVMLATIIDGKVAIGYSLCNFKFDQFDYLKGDYEPAFGIKVALDRATKWVDRHRSMIKTTEGKIDPKVVSIPQSIASQMAAFVARCKEYKRYEDMEFPHWVNDLFHKDKTEAEIYE